MALQGWWNWCVGLLPMWMAPNLVTLIGTGFALMSMIQFIPYDLSFSEEFPPAWYYFGAFCVFVYQTFDAVDGK